MASRVLRAFIGAARGHVEQAGRATGVAYGGQVDDHGDVTVTPLGVAPHVLIDCIALGFVGVWLVLVSCEDRVVMVVVVGLGCLVRGLVFSGWGRLEFVVEAVVVEPVDVLGGRGLGIGGSLPDAGRSLSSGCGCARP